MNGAARVERPKVVLLSFCDSLGISGVVPAGRIFDELIRGGIWYVPRRSKDLVEGTTVLFYQAQSGARGYATVNQVLDATGADQEILRQRGLHHLAIKLRIADIVVFSNPVRLAPIVSRLDFVTNKKYWGHAVRSTPRTIPALDFETIVAAAQAQG
jgi:hypothetical protein